MAENKQSELISSIKWDEAGLVPAIVQDAQSKEVLMMAYMNKESLQLSVESGVTWFWSRSRNELWNKGATSGHTQRITSLAYDCDGDTLLVKVSRRGRLAIRGATAVSSILLMQQGMQRHPQTYSSFGRPLCYARTTGRRNRRTLC